MKLVCLHTGQLLDQRNSGLSAAEGLRLEEHLATCSSCRADANLLEGLSALSAAAHVSMGAPARERAIANALSAGARAHVTRAAPTRRVGMLLLGAAAALAIGFVAVQGVSREPASGRVLSGEVQVAGSARAAGDALSSQVHLQTRDAAVVALGHARVELRADSDARWDGAGRKLDLQRGSGVFEVDPAQHQSFRVETKAFTVMVLGTRFEVTQDAVVVLSGRVSVQPKAAGEDAPAITLTAGSARSRFDLQPKAADDDGSAARTGRSATQLDAQAANADAVRGQPSSEKDTKRMRAANAAAATRAANTSAGAVEHAQAADIEHDRRAAARTKPNEPRASALLELARSQLAARELAQARDTLARAKPRLQNPALRAQALSLEAECELQAKHYGAARDSYLQVARRFSGMPAAETALFAAARIEAEHGEPARAAELLSSYLAKHPQGSFVREAQRRLQLLPEGAAP